MTVTLYRQACDAQAQMLKGTPVVGAKPLKRGAQAFYRVRMEGVNRAASS